MTRITSRAGLLAAAMAAAAAQMKETEEYLAGINDDWEPIYKHKQPRTGGLKWHEIRAQQRDIKRARRGR